MQRMREASPERLSRGVCGGVFLRGLPRISLAPSYPAVTEPLLTPAVRALIHGPVATIAHVELLLALWRCRPEARGLDALVQEARVSSASGARTCLDEMTDAGLIDATGDGWALGAIDGEVVGISELAAMYLQRPVTLVRALYARPTTPTRTFRELFRRRES